MSNPASSHAAARQCRALLSRRLPGSRKGTVRAHLQRAERIGDCIWRRWQLGPHRWQLKHLRWYLETQTADLNPTTRYRYWLTIRKLAQSLMQEDWIERLDGPWVRPTGIKGSLHFGRPQSKPTPLRDTVQSSKAEPK